MGRLRQRRDSIILTATTDALIGVQTGREQA
jgi:hypothetical protein